MNSKTQTLVDNAMLRIEAAVTEGLKEPDDTALSKVVALRDGKPELASHVQFSWDPPVGNPALTSRALVATVDNVHELQATHPLAISDLDPEFGATKSVADWAAATRVAERRWVIQEIEGQATSVHHPLSATDLALAAQGSDTALRLIALQHVAHLEEHCEKLDIEYVDATHLQWHAAFGVAMLYPCDKFAASRLEPFEMTYELSTNTVTLILAERLELIGFTGTPAADVRRFLTAAAFAAP